jgi:hypothetical protein
MTEQELRTLVRQAIAQQMAGPRPSAEARAASEGGSFGGQAHRVGASLGSAQFAVPSGPEGTCIIEPSVMCNHCGYCKSYGH